LLRIKPYLILTLAFTACLWILYGSSLTLWMDQLPGGGEDGAKNFYTLAYHAQHDDSSLWFDGMNYPYGEHVSYTDNQPIFSIALQWLNKILPISDHLTFLFVWMMMLSSLLGAFFIFDILKKLGVSAWLAIIGAVLIIFLNPQWLRLSGHYSLAHSFIIPWYLWMLLNYFSNGNRSLIFLILIPLLGGLVHPYFLVMLALFGGTALFIQYWSNRDLINLKSIMHIALVALAPILLFQLFMSLTDPVLDRSASPYGFLVYRATLSSVFLPVSLPHGAFLDNLIPGWFRQSEEGGFYIGLLALVGIAAGLLGIVRKLVNRDSVFHSLGRSHIFLLASIPVLLLALGLPFIIIGQSYLLEYTGPLQQFRGIGRFSFVFFFVVNIYALVLVNKWIQESTQWKRILAFGLLVLMAIETVAYTTYIAEHTSSGSNAFHNSHVPDFIDASLYEAILPLPYYHIGSENFRTNHNHSIVVPSMKLSLGTALPLMSVQLSRTSYQQTKRSLQFTNHHLSEISLLSDLNSDPILLIVDPQSVSKKSERQLIQTASSLGQENGMEFYSLTLDQFLQIKMENLEALLDDSLLVLVADPEVIKGRSSLYFDGFDDLPTTSSFIGKGALSFQRREWTSLIPEGYTWPVSEDVIVSFWLNIKEQNVANTQVWMGSVVDGEASLELSEVCDHLQAISEDWALIEINVVPSFQNPSTQIKLHRDGPNVDVTIDELLIRPSSLNVKRSGMLNMNNYYYSTETNE